jgi:hypothetical protein
MKKLVESKLVESLTESGADTIAQAQAMGSGAPEAPQDGNPQSFMISIGQDLNVAGRRLEDVQQELSSAIDSGFD